MKRTPKPIEREEGLYKNGARWWIRRVRSPLSNTAKPMSTGTKDLARANTIKRTVDALGENRTQWEWLELALTGELTLDVITNHYTAGTLHLLREERAQQAAAGGEDPDLEPYVAKWVAHINRIDPSKLSSDMKLEYERQIRFLIPEGKPFPVSQFTPDPLLEKLNTLTMPHSDAPVKGSTKRRYIAPWQLFYKWARTRVKFTMNPFEDRTWIPNNADPRSTFWDFERVQTCLTFLAHEDYIAMALVFGTGIELGALLVLTAADVSKFEKSIVDDERTIVAHGTKNGARKDRTVFVDMWAWALLRRWIQDRKLLPMARVFSYNPATDGKDLRERFYWAQVAAGYVAKPVKNKKTGKYLWGAVEGLHHIHDARHSYCQIRALGLDGEDPQDITYLASQLGHADEHMVMKVYKKANIKQRLLLIQKRRAQQAAKAAGGK